MALYLAHTFVLLLASFGAARSLLRGGAERLLAMGLVAWGNLVVTSLLLSCLHRLGDPAWFFRTSLGLAGATWLMLRRIAPEPAPAVGETGRDRPSPLLLAAFILTLAPIAYASIRIAGTYLPNNYDSLAYHLPRAMFYLGQDNLAHFDTGNPRQTYFPFNYNLLQLFSLIYSPPLQVVNFLNLAAWAGAGLAVYRLCRLCAYNANAALTATWLAVTATQVLAQATATTNDLPTAAGLLAALVFALRWRQSRQTRDALLAGLAAGLTAGSKLTVVFFGPAAALIVLGLAWGHWRRGETRAFLAGVRAWFVPGLLAFLFAAPFALINLAEKGEWINRTYDFTLNRPFSFACARQTGAAYLVQLFLEPLHRFTFDLQFTAQLNTWGARTIFPHWNEAYAFSPLYLFPPDLNEDHVWFGFTGPAILLAAVFCLVRWRRLPAPAVWLALVGLGWFVTYFLLNKWSLYNQRYFVPAILVMSPCVAAVLQAGWDQPRLSRLLRNLVAGLALCTLWLTGIYLFQNTSRPYAPLWAGQPPPPALPALPPLMVQRLAEQSRINVHSTDGNERIFLLMTHGRGQRFTSFARPDPAAYNVYSHWGFVRKVAYSNIEQLSSYTVVTVPTKRTAGVEFLGTINQGQPALDYYGLVPHADRTGATGGNRNVMVIFSYAPREPNRYMHLRLDVVGLNPADRARLLVGVDYTDGTSATLATFSATGQAPASVTRPFRRFTIRVESVADGGELGAINLPYLTRDLPPEIEAPMNPATIMIDELVTSEPRTLVVSEGLGVPEGPYAQWQLPLVRWARAPVVRLELPAIAGLEQLDLSFSLRAQARDAAAVDIVFNGELVKACLLQDRTAWSEHKLTLRPGPGPNVIEFRNVAVGTEPDWLDYLARYPDVKAYVVAQGIPLAQGAREHYETFGKKETRALYHQRRVETLAGEPLYYVFRSLRLEGFRKP
ncbi:MAG: glycosyltransferase family 39 protein [Opitutae bacterium]|nr:glycosyltransferase family 39 protein [Opitutae bacterium]